MPPLRALARLCAVLTVGLSTSACLFPVIDFDELSAPQAVALRPRPAGHVALAHTSASAGTGLSSPPSAASAGPLLTPPRQHIAGGWRDPEAAPQPVRQPKPSVIAPEIPAPEAPKLPGADRCHETLRKAGVQFTVIPDAEARGVPWPIRLEGPMRGVRFEVEDHSAVHEILDCRLALVLREWARDLKRAGIRRVTYYSMYRPGARIAGSGAVSGHAHGLAIDAARFGLENGETVDVLEDWDGKKRGEAPCPLRNGESRFSRLLRTVTCAAVDQKLFQVVLTPHYNKAHENHVHLELRPDANWTYVR